MQIVGKDRQFAFHGAMKFAVHADQVAQIEALGKFPIFIAHLVLADHHLDGAGPIANLQPMDLARRTPQYNPSCRSNVGAVLLRRFSSFTLACRFHNNFINPVADLGNCLVPIKSGTPRVHTQFSYFAQFIPSGCLQGLC